MESNSALATRTGHLHIPGAQLISQREAEKLPPGDVCFIVTGSQGEPGSAHVAHRDAREEESPAGPRRRGDLLVARDSGKRPRDRCGHRSALQVGRGGLRRATPARPRLGTRVSRRASRDARAHAPGLLRPVARRVSESRAPRAARRSHGRERGATAYCLTDGDVLELLDGEPRRGRHRARGAGDDRRRGGRRRRRHRGP